jgi:hypothetical protein
VWRVADFLGTYYLLRGEPPPHFPLSGHNNPLALCKVFSQGRTDAHEYQTLNIFSHSYYLIDCVAFKMCSLIALTSIKRMRILGYLGELLVGIMRSSLYQKPCLLPSASSPTNPQVSAEFSFPN